MERLETVNTKSYLFCVGFDLLGGILRKLESTCLERFFLLWRKSTKECTCIDEKTSALALVDRVNNSSDRVRARAASAMDQLFMVVEDLGSYGRDACCIKSGSDSIMGSCGIMCSTFDCCILPCLTWIW
ncbi:hypothetical protein VNO78_18672 [Psophocarpus tetragonolobus]|uniref:Uncharacterized protein n=1 Tax=Psophocarpus tetragonolobus TaxID=3891 RepID=A0AAN9XLR4_PSOTE